MSRNSSRKPCSRKAAGRPKKPYPDFPLTPHASGAWQKKIRGKVYYFGRWAKRVNGKLERIDGDGWKEALEAYKAVADDLHAGRTPRVTADVLTVGDLCNRFLTAKVRKVESGELGSRMFAEYKEITDRIVAAFGKTRRVDDLAADDFQSLRATLAERWGPVRLGNAITRVKTVFKFGMENGLVEKQVRYGSEFKKPGKSVLRRHKALNGKNMLEANEVRRLLDGASVPLRAMILLGVNAGFGNNDCAALPLLSVNLETGTVDFPRPKTGIARRCPLWPETVAAIREALAARPEPRQDEKVDLVFLTSRGTHWIHNTAAGRRIDNITIQFTLLLKKLDIYRKGLGFYTLRHTFRTIADAARDPVAIDLIMGHSDPSMGGHYRERIDDSRLQAVAEHVRQWLFGATPEDGTSEGAESTTPDTADPCEPADTPGADEGDARPMLRLFAG